MPKPDSNNNGSNWFADSNGDWNLIQYQLANSYNDSHLDPICNTTIKPNDFSQSNIDPATIPNHGSTTDFYEHPQTAKISNPVDQEPSILR